MKQAYAAVSRAKSQPLILECIGIDEPRSDEILVRIVASGVCHTDMVVRDQGYDVPQPLVLGHEGSGVVEKVGADVKGLQAGDHVALSYAYCGNVKSAYQAPHFIASTSSAGISVGHDQMAVARFTTRRASRSTAASLNNPPLPPLPSPPNATQSRYRRIYHWN